MNDIFNTFNSTADHIFIVKYTSEPHIGYCSFAMSNKLLTIGRAE